MLKVDYFHKVVRSVLSSESSENDVLALMVVLHTHRFHITPSVLLDDAGEARVLFPLTRRHSAEIVASAFPASDKRRRDRVYWYSRYSELTPFEVASRVDGEWRTLIDAMTSRLKQTGLVGDLSEDD